ncbi:MAG: hypothetical protein Kow0069_25230 [Promethearchaeota archaeon]
MSRGNERRGRRGTVLVVPHYVNALRYYDRLYEPLMSRGLELAYAFYSTPQFVDAMKAYCLERGRRHVVLEDARLRRSYQYLEPYYRYRLLRQVRATFDAFRPSVLVQTNDMTFFNDAFVKVAKERNVPSVAYQWAVTVPESLLRYVKRLNEQARTKVPDGFKPTASPLRVAWRSWVRVALRVLHAPVELALGVRSNHVQSIGQGDSDYFVAINEYTKRLLVRQGVSAKKILVGGLFHHDDAVASRDAPVGDLRHKYGLPTDRVVVTCFNQPFYAKDLRLLSFEEQRAILSRLVEEVFEFYSSVGKEATFVLKLHPAEDPSAYEGFADLPGVVVLWEANNVELARVSQVCVGWHSTALQTVLLLDVPLISLDVDPRLPFVSAASRSMGVRSNVKSWEAFRETLRRLDSNGYRPLERPLPGRLIADGRCQAYAVELIDALSRGLPPPPRGPRPRPHWGASPNSWRKSRT